MEKKFVSANEIQNSFRYNFGTWFNAMTSIEPIVPKELELKEGEDYIIANDDLYLSFEGAHKIKTFIHLKQSMDLKDWFENCARGKSLTFGTK